MSKSFFKLLTPDIVHICYKDKEHVCIEVASTRFENVADEILKTIEQKFKPEEMQQ